MKDDEWIWAVLLLGFVFWLVSRNTTDGIYESNYINCEKPAGSKEWRSDLLNIADRWSAIEETDYQVSFQAQRVVAEFSHALKGCEVFDRKNWMCDGGFTVRDGDMSTRCTELDRPFCSLHLDWISHPLVYIRGADWMCTTSSTVLDISYEGMQRLRQ